MSYTCTKCGKTLKIKSRPGHNRRCLNKDKQTAKEYAHDKFFERFVIRGDPPPIPGVRAYGFEDVQHSDEFMLGCMLSGIEGILRYFRSAHERDFNVRIVDSGGPKVVLWDGQRWIGSDIEEGLAALADDCVSVFEAWFKSNFGDYEGLDMECVEAFVREVVAPTDNFWENVYWMSPDDPIFKPDHEGNAEYQRRLMQGFTTMILARQATL